MQLFSTSRTLVVFLLLGVCTVYAQPFDYPTAKPSTVWTNGPSIPHHVTYDDGSVARAVLLRLNQAGYGPSFAFGFFCTNHGRPPCPDFLLAVAVVYCNSGALMTSTVTGIPQVVWSANRGHPVGDNAILDFTADGDLVLRGAGGATLWSTGTAGRSVAGMSITSSGNLVLLDRNNAPVWQSFDHPTDALVIGQSLRESARLTANASTSNWSASRLYLTVAADGLSAFVDAKPPQRYYHLQIGKTNVANRAASATFLNGSLQLFVRPGEPDSNSIQLPVAVGSTVQYIRLEYDGHLRLYEWQLDGWKAVFDLLHLFPDDCAYPTVCGAYGVCTDMQCSCPDATHFRAVDFRRPNRGCVLTTPISCRAAPLHQLVSLKNVTYFDGTSMATLARVSEKACKEACLKNCACKAAVFNYGRNVADGNCYLQSEVFSLQTRDPEIIHYNSSVHVKVQVKSWF